MGFGQHQTFYLRQQWLTKGLIEVDKNPRFFYEPEHFEVLGVGKNMAKSIRYWLGATKLVKEKRSIKTELYLTELGEAVFNYDRYVKSRFTLSILHYLLVTEKNEASTWFWFFNVFNERVFTKTLLYSQLEQWAKDTFEKDVSINSLKRDIDCLLQLYTMKSYTNQTPEDVIKSPFESLNLVQSTTETHYIKTPLKHSLTGECLYITLLLYINKYGVKEVGLNDLINEPELWGRVFNLGRDEIIDHLDNLQEKYGIIFTRTNRLDVVRIEHEVQWDEVLKSVYENEVLV
ncbi:DUF4007 family protein [Lysinibacillus fusiformis]|uniref:DUF4007 family protein n=1 Tax=Lysinibacillus fusiformis TaxID=28031 RepID=UPI00380FDCE1